MFLCKEKSIINIITIALICSMLYLVNNSIISFVGAVSIIGFCGYIFFLLVVNIKNNKCLGLLFTFFIIFIVNLINVTLHFSTNSIYVFLQSTIFLCFPLLFKSIKLEEENLNKLYYRIECITIILSIILFLLKILGLENVLVQATIYKTLLGGALLILYKRKNLLIALMFVVGFFILGERTSALILIIFKVGVFLLRSIKRWPTALSIFGIILVLLIIFPFFYVYLSHTEFGLMLNNFTKQLTGENFFSGRHAIWELILNIPQNFFGLGWGNNFLEANGINGSTHNLFMFIYLAGGYLSLILYSIYFLIIAYLILINSKPSLLMIWISILLLVSFELLLLNNNMAVSMWLWVIVSYGLVEKKNDFTQL